MAVALQNYVVPSMVTPPRTPQFQIKSEPYENPETPTSTETLQQPVIKTEPAEEYESHKYIPTHYQNYNPFQQLNGATNFGNPLGNLETRFGPPSPLHAPSSPNTSDPRPELPVTPESPLGTTQNPTDSESPIGTSENYQDFGTPKKNQNKQKSFRCRMCDFVAATKEESWVHLKTHLKPEKMLCCPRCPFVTEYKHHLEYHLLNHDGSKPFVCPECEYMCVNKSMLRSHLKSHSQIYQYRCKDCDYVSKYCHTFKIHLRKYRHEPRPVLNADGSEDHTKIIDVYGSRRGPRKRTISIDSVQSTSATNLRPIQLPMQNPMQTQVANPHLVQNPLAVPKIPQMISDDASVQQQIANPLFNPFLVNSMVLAQFMNLQRFVAELRNRSLESSSEPENNNDDYTCNVCGVSFKTETLFGIHMQYHDPENPLRCKTCGKTNANGENFFIHLTRERH